MTDTGPQSRTKKNIDIYTKNLIYAMLFGDNIPASFCFNEKGYMWVYCNEPAFFVVFYRDRSWDLWCCFKNLGMVRDILYWHLLIPLLLIHTVYFCFLRVLSGLGRLGGCCLDWRVWEFLVKHVFCSYSTSVSHIHFQFPFLVSSLLILWPYTYNATFLFFVSWLS